MYSLRQKTWGVYIRPYIVFRGDRLVQRGGMSVASPCQTTGNERYENVMGGSAWMLYNDELFTAFALAREKVKEIMDTLGYSKNDIMVGEIVPMDTIVTPIT